MCKTNSQLQNQSKFFFPPWFIKAVASISLPLGSWNLQCSAWNQSPVRPDDWGQSGCSGWSQKQTGPTQECSRRKQWQRGCHWLGGVKKWKKRKKNISFLNGCNNSLILKYQVKLRHTYIRVFLIFHRLEKHKSNLSLLQGTVREFEVCHIALGCIKNGESPVVNGKYILYFLNMLAPSSNRKWIHVVTSHTFFTSFI